MPKERLSGGKRIESCRITAPASKSPLVSPAAIAICKADIRAFFSRFTQGASAKTVWGPMRAEQVCIAQRWRRPRSDPEYTERRSDTGQADEKCSRNGTKGNCRPYPRLCFFDYRRCNTQ